MEHSKNIYDEVRRETDAVLQSLEQPTKNPELSSAIDTARDSFRQLKAQSDILLLELDKNVEWDAFTIAFYGETNAGKSTIIETLRILMGEKTKLEQQRKFRETCEKFGIDASSVELWERKKLEIAGYENDLQCSANRYDSAVQEQKNIGLGLTYRANQLISIISDLPFWRRWFSFIWKVPEKTLLVAIKYKIAAAVAEERRLLALQEKEKEEISGKIESVRKDMARIDAGMRELVAYEDGSIIGDGQPDFTRESTRYEFEVNGNKVVLLDVPGIEGKEELVLVPIMQAVRKAHAVFYVTRKADPPQKGDEKSCNKGTLEKIKEHLGAQTEVWTIFNKGMKSAEQLRMPSLVNEGERGGLAVLEEEMRRQLGGHYVGLLSVSAYAAFLSATDHLLPGGVKSKDRKKFLAALDPESISRKTGFHDLTDMLGSEMVENSRLKIRKSNFNKANEAVLALKDSVDLLNKKQFGPLFDQLEREAHASSLQIESAADALKSRLESDAGALIDGIRKEARRKIYGRIDSDIGNDEFKVELKHCIERHGQALEEELPKMVRENVDEFQDEIQGIAEQFREHVQGFLEDASKCSPINFKLNINIDNGIKVSGLMGIVIGAAFLWWNPAGWVLGAIAVVDLLISFVKAVWRLFDSDYKKSQQRKSADENLDRAFGSVKAEFLSQLQSNIESLEEKLKDIKSAFQLPAMQAERIKSSLTDSSRRLAHISKKIVKEGGL